MKIAQTASQEVEVKPARLQCQDGERSGTIYIRRVGGRVLEAYRGFSYTLTPLARILRYRPESDEQSGPE